MIGIFLILAVVVVIWVGFYFLFVHNDLPSDTKIAHDWAEIRRAQAYLQELEDHERP